MALAGVYDSVTPPTASTPPVSVRKIPASCAGRYLRPPIFAPAARPVGSCRRKTTVRAMVLTPPRPVVAPAASWRSAVLVANSSEAQGGQRLRTGDVTG